MLYRHRNILSLVLIAVLGLMGNVVAQQQRTARATSPDFFARLAESKSNFYHDEVIQAGVLRRSDKPERDGCGFGINGTLQLLRNGLVVYEYKTGPVSAAGQGIIDGVSFQYFGAGMYLSLALKEEVDQTDNYQIRATCGGEISEPSASFHLSPWGNPVAGLTVYARPIKTEFLTGEPIMVEVTMKNAGTKPLRCPVPRADDGYAKPFWQLEPYWQAPQPYRENDPEFDRTLQILQPEEIKTAIFNLSNFNRHPAHKTPALGTEPGTYQVWFEVFFQQDIGEVPKQFRSHLWRNELTSNIFKIVIK